MTNRPSRNEKVIPYLSLRPSTTESSIKYYVLLPRQSSLRLPVNNVLPDSASKKYELHVLWVSRAGVEEEGDHAVRDEHLLEVPHQRLFQSGLPDEAYNYNLTQFHSLDRALRAT
ncbi:hypothetical protein H4582DRAFT_2067920 [Lactarius indigo]|nr:hypothetical protein H4582DRAFT_2067920 [Lactarius indigo]